MRLTLDKPDTVLDGMRWGVQKFIRMMDELHLYGVVGLRTYELAVRRRSFSLQPDLAFRMLGTQMQQMRYPRWRTLPSTTWKFFRGGIRTSISHRGHQIRPASAFPISSMFFSLDASGKKRRQVNGGAVLIGSRDAVETAHQPYGQDALGERFTFRIGLFCIFISLDTAFKEAQSVAGREVVSLAPLLQRPDLPDLFPKLLDCLKDKVGGFSTRSSPPLSMLTRSKRSLIPWVAESRGWRVVNMDHWKPQVFRLEPNATLSVSQGHLNAVVLLQDRGTVILADNSGKELRWEPDQLLCYAGQSVHYRNERGRPFCLLIQLEVEQN